MKWISSRVTMLLGLASLISASPLPIIDSPGAIGQVGGGQPSISPKAAADATVPQRKRVSFLLPGAEQTIVYPKMGETAPVTVSDTNTVRTTPPGVVTEGAEQIVEESGPRSIVKPNVASSVEAGQTMAFRRPDVAGGPVSPPRIRLKSPFPGDWGKPVPAVEAKSMATEGRSWLPSWKWPSWASRPAAAPGATSAGVIERVGGRPSVAPYLVRQNAVVGRPAATSSASWWQKISEGARGLFRRIRGF